MFRSPLVANIDVDAEPASVIGCRSTDDVVRAIRSSIGPVAIRGGGYSPAGLGTIDGGTVIDVAPLRRVTVDLGARRVTLGGGALAGQVDGELQRAGLAATLPVPSRAGVTGAALSGGVGFLVRKLGLICDAIVGATVVTASGEVVDAGDPEHAELLWALRGGGGNFGVVTELVLEARVLRDVSVGQYVYAIDVAADALRRYRDWTATMPDDLTAVAMLRALPLLPGVSAEQAGRPVLLVSTVHAGTPSDAARDVAAFADHGHPLVRRELRMSLGELRAMTDAGFPHARFGVLTRSGWCDELTDEAIDAAVEAATELPRGESMIEIVRMRGVIDRVDDSFSAAPGRDAEFLLNVMGLWTEPREGENTRSWVAEADARTRTMRREDGVVPGFVAADELSLADATYGALAERLRSVKQRYDPGNRFARNLNLSP
jgi:FAD/FMN-containing dehydrogenase